MGPEILVALLIVILELLPFAPIVKLEMVFLNAILLVLTATLVTSGSIATAPDVEIFAVPQ